MIMKNELGKMWKETAVAQLKLLSRNFPEGAEEIMKTSVRTVGRDSNRALTG
jgi:hypothetical protein